MGYIPYGGHHYYYGDFYREVRCYNLELKIFLQRTGYDKCTFHVSPDDATLGNLYIDPDRDDQFNFDSSGLGYDPSASGLRSGNRVSFLYYSCRSEIEYCCGMECCAYTEEETEITSYEIMFVCVLL